MQLVGALFLLAQKRDDPATAVNTELVGSTVALHVVPGAIENEVAFADPDSEVQPEPSAMGPGDCAILSTVKLTYTVSVFRLFTKLMDIRPESVEVSVLPAVEQPTRTLTRKIMLSFALVNIALTQLIVSTNR